MMKVIVVALLSFVFVACGKHESDHPVMRVHATKINSDLFMGLPMVMKIFPGDSVLWISDFRTDPMVSGVHKKTGRVLRQIARKGNGPSEMVPPVHIYFHNRDLCIYDRNKRKLYSTPVDSVLANDGKQLHAVTSFSNGQSLVYNLTDSTYIGSGHFDKRFSITDSMGKELYQACELPQFWSEERKFPNRVRSMYHQALRWCRHPSRPLFVAATSDVLSAYSIGSETIDEVFQLPLHNYTYDYEDGYFVSTQSRPDVPVGILDVACDSSYVYVLYDPNSQKETQKADTEIRLYTWEGVLEKTLIPDTDLSMMALDVADHAIYGISTGENEPAIWRVQLP